MDDLIYEFSSLKEALNTMLPKEDELQLLVHAFKAGREVRKHYHPNADEWVFVDNGEFDFYVDDDTVFRVFGSPTDVKVIHVAKNRIHGTKMVTDATYLVVRDAIAETAFVRL